MDIQAIASLFDARAARYVDDGWHRRYARQFVEAVPLRPGDRVLDAGTGTGFAALAAADRVGPEGLVVGVDVSPRMLEQARALVAREGATNVELRDGDASTLAGFEDRSFDAVIYSAGLLYMPVAPSLRRWRDLLTAGGLVAFSTMQAGSPATGRIFRECASAFGLSVEDPSESLGHPDRCRQTLEAAGFQDPIVITDTVPFDTIDPTLAWEANSRSAAHSAVLALDSDDRDRLRDAFIAALQRAQSVDPAGTTRADVLLAMGRRW